MGLVGAGSRVGAQMQPVLKKRAAQSAAAVAGSKATQAQPKASAPTTPQLPGILGTMQRVGQRKTGRGGKMSSR